MNEIVDRIEQVVMEAARRRTARRRRRTVLAVAALAALLLVSGASAVTGVGPLGAALTSDEKLPPGAKPARGGESVTLAAEAADGRRYEVRAYRVKPSRGGHLRGAPGTYRYCVASYSAASGGRRDPLSVICTSGTELAAKLVQRRTWLECSGRGGVSGRAKPPDPVCGLTLADTANVTIEPNRGHAGDVLLSDPFSLRVNRQRLPAVLRVRAILGVIEAPATQPGQRAPRVKVTTTAAGGDQVSTYVGGSRVPAQNEFPSFDPTPQPGGPRAGLTTAGARGERWTMTAWRTSSNDHCASSKPAGRPQAGRSSLFCAWAPELGRFRSLVLDGGLGMASRVESGTVRDGQSYAVYGLARADATAIQIRDPSGRTWDAELGAPWATMRRQPGDLQRISAKWRKRFAGLPRSVRIRVFQAVIPAPPAPTRRGIAIEVSLRDGRLLTSHAANTPRRRSSLPPPP